MSDLNAQTVDSTCKTRRRASQLVTLLYRCPAARAFAATLSEAGKMKTVIRAMLSILIMLYCSESADAAQNLFSLSVDGPQSAIKIGDRVEIGVTVENISDSLLHAVYASPPDSGELDFVPVVRDANGKVLPRTQYGKQIFGDPGVSGGVHYHSYPPLVLAPGDQFKRTIVLSDLYVMKTPGMYTVVVSTVPKFNVGFGVQEMYENIMSNSIHVMLEK